MPINGYITQAGSHPDPLSDHSRAHHNCKVRAHKSQPAQSIKTAHSNNFMGKMDSWQVRGCCHSGWMAAEGRAELWSSRDEPALPAEPPALPSSPCRAAHSSGTLPLLRGSKGAIPREDKALQCCLREQSTQVVPGTGKMIREQEHRVLEQSLTFTNHRVWQGRKDRSRLAARLSHTTRQAQQVPQHCQPSTQSASSSPAVGQGRAASGSHGGVPSPGRHPGEGLLMDGQRTGKMTPVHHISLLSKDTLLPEQVRGVCGCSLTPQPWARTHRGPCHAALPDGESTEPARKWSQCLITLCSNSFLL